MKNNGIVPPHFLYFLENEEVFFTNFKSGDNSNPTLYDRITVKMPFSNTTFDIQVIFNNLDYSLPPDFIPITNCNQLVLNYANLIKNWNFRESSTLYYTIKKIKDEYSSITSKKCISFLEDQIASKEINDYNRDRSNEGTGAIFSSIRDWISFLQSKTKNVEMNMQQEKARFEIVLSYPVDIVIRSRNIERKPILNIVVDVVNLSFAVYLRVPSFVSVEGLELKFGEQIKELRNFKTIINKYEISVLEYFQMMSNREMIINKILNLNIGFPLEIDTKSFNRACIYLTYNKASKNSKEINDVANNSINYVISFDFRATYELEIKVIDTHLMKNILTKRIPCEYDVKGMEDIVTKIMRYLGEIIS